MIDTEQAEKDAATEWERQTEHATDPAMRSKALYVAIRAFQAALGIQGTDVSDYVAACTLLGDALDEYLGDDEPSVQSEVVQ